MNKLTQGKILTRFFKEFVYSGLRLLMDTNDFREIALGFSGAEEGSHMGHTDFRVGGRIFATLASQDQGLGNLMLSPELQQSLISSSPDVFFPIHGGWGRMGATHVRLSLANESQLAEALRLAWSLRVEKNNKPRSRGKPANKVPKRKK